MANQKHSVNFLRAVATSFGRVSCIFTHIETHTLCTLETVKYYYGRNQERIQEIKE